MTSLATVMSKPVSRGEPLTGRRGRRRCRAGRGRSCPRRGRQDDASTDRCSSCVAVRACRGVDAWRRSRLLATPTAWMSPVRWRLKSSIGTTWRVAAAGGAALDAEDRARATAARMHEHGLLADAAPGPATGRPWYVLPSPSGVGVMAVTSMYLPCGVLEALEHGHVVDLGLVLAVELQLVVQDAGLGGDLLDRQHGRSLGDLDVGLQRILLWQSFRAFSFEHRRRGCLT